MDLEKQHFFETYSAYAMAEQQRCGIPASITLAQMALESSWGKSTPALRSNNYFGIKVHGEYNQEGRYDRYSDDRPNEKFCRYQNVQESIADHSRLLTTEKYQKCIGNASDTDHYRWITGIQAAGYATDVNYVSTIENIISENHLDEYDKVAHQAKAEGRAITPESPSQNYFTGYAINYMEKNFSFPMDMSKTNRIVISSDYGWRTPPVPGASSNHKGIDIPMPVGTPLLATEDNGQVIAKGHDNKSGNYIKVAYPRDGGKEFIVTYMHMSEIDSNIITGSKVMAGQQLGKSGNTGTSSGAHLHMSVQFGDSTENHDKVEHINPKIYVTELALRQCNNNITMVRQGGNGTDLLADYKSQMQVVMPPIQVDPQKSNLVASQEGMSNDMFGVIARLKKNEMLGDFGGSSDVIADLVGAVFETGMAMSSLFAFAVQEPGKGEKRADATLDPNTVLERHREGLENINAKQMSSNAYEAENPEQHQGRSLAQR